MITCSKKLNSDTATAEFLLPGLITVLDRHFILICNATREIKLTMGPPQLTLLLLLASLSLSAAAYKPHMSVWNPPAHLKSSLKQQVPTAGEQRDQQGDLISKCKLHWRNATLDHFTWVRRLVSKGLYIPWLYPRGSTWC
jgi:hypothetical protein